MTDEQFKRLERQAFDGSIDLDRLPAAEYRYFDMLRRLYHKYKFEGISQEYARKMKNIAYNEYLHDKAEQERMRCAYIQYQYNIKLAEELKAEINKAPAEDKLAPALKVVGLLTGDDLFYKINERI